MAAITITIIESELRLVAGIPDTIVLETNVPATVFYTLDGSEPSTSSDIAIEPIKMPTNKGTVVLKAFATDGVDTSPVIEQDFGTTTAYQRQPHDKIAGAVLTKCCGFPFASTGSNSSVNGQYLNTGGVTVNDPLKPQIPDGYDGTATSTFSNYTNENVYSYDLLFTQTNSIGEMGRGIGTLPAGVTTVKDESNSPPQETDASSAFFDPKALVIYQDGRVKQYDEDVPRINRPYFNLENEETARDGMLKQTSDVQAPMGSALRQHFNPSDNTIQYSYWDTRTNRWIISKVPYTPKNENIGNYSGIVFPSSRDPGARYVFKWIPFQYRRLF